jgi:hypothetical protein
MALGPWPTPVSSKCDPRGQCNSATPKSKPGVKWLAKGRRRESLGCVNASLARRRKLMCDIKNHINS